MVNFWQQKWGQTWFLFNVIICTWLLVMFAGWGGGDNCTWRVIKNVRVYLLVAVLCSFVHTCLSQLRMCFLQPFMSW